MADLVGAFAASHGPIIARDWETMPKDHRNRLAAAFDEIGQRLKAQVGERFEVQLGERFEVQLRQRNQ